jgi:hypothetical protein
MRGQQLRAVSIVTIDGVDYILDELPEDVKEEWRRRTLERIGRQVGISLSSRPEEAKKALAAYEAGEL